MPKPDHARPSTSRGQRSELVRLVRRIQALTLELRQLRQRGGEAAELNAKERRLEQLRWRLAGVARNAAANGLDDAA